MLDAATIFSLRPDFRHFFSPMLSRAADFLRFSFLSLLRDDFLRHAVAIC